MEYIKRLIREKKEHLGQVDHATEELLLSELCTRFLGII